MMEDQIKKLKCELCGNESFMLVSIEVATDTWGGRKGICPKCFKDGDVEEKVFLQNKKFLEEQIISAGDRKSFWEKELAKLTHPNL